MVFREECRCRGRVGFIQRLGLDQEVQDRGEDGERGDVGGDVKPRKMGMAEEDRDAEIADVPVFKCAGDLGVFAERLAAEIVSCAGFFFFYG